MVYYRVHKNQPLDPILNKFIPVHIPTPYHFNIILPSMPRSSKWSLCFRFSD